MDKLKRKLGTFLRFGIVGVGNTLIDFAVFFLLTYLSVPYLLAQICSYAAGMINSYILNRKWTFKVKERVKFKEMMRFVVINLAASGTAFMVIYIVHDMVGISLIVSKLVATAGGIVINFIGSRFWVFQPSYKEHVEN